ncbi:hypothetical protein DPEC_G00051140 [Dallia pectoralis]|uniref:Uncharacterized protein n=1 Tax=Dallia pectoralis TaxID=75939 RepID=A0ACC2HBK7_DALPE|nr:hypothetical protein DPEC_G00051140 [Dallia pectoralis]
MDGRYQESLWKHTEEKKRAAYFSEAELEILMHAYEEFKPILLKRSNTVASAKDRELAWQKITDRVNTCNPSGPKRTWSQVKMKQKNILQKANRKKAEAQKTGLSSPPSLTPAEEQTLSLNQGRAIVDGIPGGTSSESDTSHDTSGLAKFADGHIVIMEPFAIAQPVTVKVEAEDAPSELENEHDWSPPENMAGDSYADDPSSSTQILGTLPSKELYNIHLQRQIRKSDMEMELIKHQVEETKLNIKKASLEIELLEHRLKEIKKQ